LRQNNAMENEKQFKSKRNKVYYRDGRVIKEFTDSTGAKAEAETLRHYRDAGLGVPNVISCCNNAIEMEYIPGDTIPDFLERMEKQSGTAEIIELADRSAKIRTTEICFTASMLVEWFAQFYEVVEHVNSGEIRGDVNGRNFIITQDRIVGVDFEDHVYGIIEQDIGRLLAFIRTYDLPGESAQRRFARLFCRLAVNRLYISPDEVRKQYHLEIAAMKERRGQSMLNDISAEL